MLLPLHWFLIVHPDLTHEIFLTLREMSIAYQEVSAAAANAGRCGNAAGFVSPVC
jgi:hypothetical protein